MLPGHSTCSYNGSSGDSQLILGHDLQTGNIYLKVSVSFFFKLIWRSLHQSLSTSLEELTFNNLLWLYILKREIKREEKGGGGEIHERWRREEEVRAWERRSEKERERRVCVRERERERERERGRERERERETRSRMRSWRSISEILQFLDFLWLLISYNTGRLNWWYSLIIRVTFCCNKETLHRPWQSVWPSD